MHDTANLIGALFFSVYLPDETREYKILDVGAMDVNGSLRRLAPPRSTYVGIDMEAGPGVDIVLKDPHVFPFETQSFDALISTSAFEHDSMFWLTFLEMVRVTRKGGAIYINVPSNATYHRYARDCWRFYPDAALALTDWARRNGHNISLAESFTALRRRDVWNDYVMVFTHSLERDAASSRIVDAFPGSQNVRRSYAQPEVDNYSESTEDMLLLRAAGWRRGTSLRIDRRMLEIRVSFSSKEDWDTWLAAHREKFPVWRKQVLDTVRTNGLTEPISNLHHSPQHIKINENDLRESISASEINSRKRAGLLVLELARSLLKPKSRPNPKILGTEALTRVARVLRGAFSYYLGLEYFPTDEEKAKHFPIGHLDLANLDFGDEAFDLFHSGDVFEHLPDLEKALSEIVRVLAPQGVAVCTFPFLAEKTETLVKARMRNGQIDYLEPAEYHGNPVRPNEGSLVFSLPAWDILALCKKVGFASADMVFIVSSTYGITSSTTGLSGIFVLVAIKGEGSKTANIAPVRRALANLSYDGPELKKIIGAVALPRSGTTVLTAIMSVHSNIKTVYEPWNANKDKKLPEAVTIDNFFDVFLTDRQNKEYLFIKETATRLEYIGKMAGLLRSVGPPMERQMIWLLRNPLHVFLSELEARQLWWGEAQLECSLDVFDRWSERTVAALRLLLRTGSEFNAILLSYERLVTKKEETIRSVMDLLQMPFEEEQLRFEAYVKKNEVRGDINVSTAPKEVSPASMERRALQESKLDSILAQSRFKTAIMSVIEACKQLEAQPNLRFYSKAGQEIVVPLWKRLAIT
jgi:ubiquinone/menaquinone biosynthesis C-methylase UbiE